MSENIPSVIAGDLVEEFMTGAFIKTDKEARISTNDYKNSYQWLKKIDSSGMYRWTHKTLKSAIVVKVSPNTNDPSDATFACYLVGRKHPFWVFRLVNLEKWQRLTLAATSDTALSSEQREAKLQSIREEVLTKSLQPFYKKFIELEAAELTLSRMKPLSKEEHAALLAKNKSATRKAKFKRFVWTFLVAVCILISGLYWTAEGSMLSILCLLLGGPYILYKVWKSQPIPEHDDRLDTALEEPLEYADQEFSEYIKDLF